MSEMRAILELNPPIGNLCEIAIEWFSAIVLKLEHDTLPDDSLLSEMNRAIEEYLKNLEILLERESDLKRVESEYMNTHREKMVEFLEGPVGQYHPDKDEILEEMGKIPESLRKMSGFVDESVSIILAYQVSKTKSLLYRLGKLKKKFPSKTLP